MKTTSTIFLAIALFACKKEQVEEPSEPDTCNCGIITAESWNQQNGTFSVSIESECSGYVATFVSDLSTYQQYGVGDRICRNGVDPW